MADESKGGVPASPAHPEPSGGGHNSFDRLTVLQDAAESDITIKPYAAQDVLPGRPDAPSPMHGKGDGLDSGVDDLADDNGIFDTLELNGEASGPSWTDSVIARAPLFFLTNSGGLWLDDIEHDFGCRGGAHGSEHSLLDEHADAPDLNIWQADHLYCDGHGG